jgi:hypothetical protein
VLASGPVSGSDDHGVRGLLVLADGVQAAFAAGAVAELARRGVTWGRGAGAGLGAQVALLALLGETPEAERRWLREAEHGCPLFESQIAAARRRMGDKTGVALSPDAWSMSGWLDRDGLAEHLAPEMAAVPARLARAGATLAVAVEDLVAGVGSWLDLAGLTPPQAGAVLRAAASFPAGWGPEPPDPHAPPRRLWGGVGAALQGPWPGAEDAADWDVVCGFPVPAVARPALGGALLELVQRRSECAAARAVGGWRSGRARGSTRILAPSAAAWREWAERDTAELGVEYPLPWERNAALTSGLVGFGAFAAREAIAATSR